MIAPFRFGEISKNAASPVRWDIETDLRSLKQTVHLHSLTAQSVDMLAKELALAVAAYNLVAHVCRGTRSRDRSSLPNLMAADSPETYQRLLDDMLRRAAQCKLPRRERPTYPRRGSNFPRRRKP